MIIDIIPVNHPLNECLLVVSSTQGPDVLSEPSEGGGRGKLKAAASSQRAERGISFKTRVVFTGLICEFQSSQKPLCKVLLDFKVLT